LTSKKSLKVFISSCCVFFQRFLEPCCPFSSYGWWQVCYVTWL